MCSFGSRYMYMCAHTRFPTCTHPHPRTHVHTPTLSLTHTHALEYTHTYTHTRESLNTFSYSISITGATHTKKLHAKNMFSPAALRCDKRIVFTWKETYTYEKRPLNIKRVIQKRPPPSCKESNARIWWHICLCIEQKTYTYFIKETHSLLREHHNNSVCNTRILWQKNFVTQEFCKTRLWRLTQNFVTQEFCNTWIFEHKNLVTNTRIS